MTSNLISKFKCCFMFFGCALGAKQSLAWCGVLTLTHTKKTPANHIKAHQYSHITNRKKNHVMFNLFLPQSAFLACYNISNLLQLICSHKRLNLYHTKNVLLMFHFNDSISSSCISLSHSHSLRLVLTMSCTWHSNHYLIKPTPQNSPTVQSLYANLYFKIWKYSGKNGEVDTT